MNITLTPESEQYLRDQIAAGKFPSADAAVSEALRRMREYDAKMDELRRDIAVGIEQADQGLATDFTEATLERVKSKARQRTN
jgi:putative addiction module CopG family antidote